MSKSEATSVMMMMIVMVMARIIIIKMIINIFCNSSLVNLLKTGK